VIDEVANCAFVLGIVLGLEAEGVDAAYHFAFSDAKSNFVSGARYGMESVMRWKDGRAIPVRELVESTLLPLAHQGLRRAGLDDSECDRYLNVIAERVATGVNGAAWTLGAYESLTEVPSRCAKAGVVTRGLHARQWRNEPVHRWSPLSDEEKASWTTHCSTVAELMSTDLFTVQADDLLDVAASVMHWKHIRHVPVLNDEGELVGLISHRAMLAYLTSAARGGELMTAQDVMTRDVPTLSPLDSCGQALAVLQREGIGGLPVVHERRLVGMLSERDFLPLAVATAAP
jgi:CBS domain-containing protein